jgi:threonine aldolase
MIDLRSDTVTRPSADMLRAMFAAPVGDDVFGEDPTVNALEARTAALFGMEAGLFCASGTMCNQIAVKAHTQALDEVICAAQSHIYNSETGAWAFHSGVSLRLVGGSDGIITPDMVLNNINPPYDWQPRSTMLAIENTCNKAGGTYYTLAQIKALSEVCKEKNLRFHIDGARIFNALLASGNKAQELSGLADSISVCFSKGLGAPVGSVLLGSKSFIAQSRRLRKAFGGGMRQAGYLAAAALFALDNHIDRLADDHRRAQQIGEVLREQNYVKHLYPVHSNIVLFDLRDGITAAQFNAALKEQGVLSIAFGVAQVRMVTHLDFDDDMLSKVLLALQNCCF